MLARIVLPAATPRESNNIANGTSAARVPYPNATRADAGHLRRTRTLRVVAFKPRSLSLKTHSPTASLLATLHFSAEASDMEQFNLSLGAHLLLWAFPLALVIFVFVENHFDGPAGEPDR